MSEIEMEISGESSTSPVELGRQKDIPKLPPGFRFDSWEIMDYVKKRNSGLPLPVDIPVVKDLYGCNPKRLQGDGFRYNNDHKMYYFTRRTLKHSKGKKCNRSTHEGYWKNNHGDKPIKDENNKIIGYKNTFTFKDSCKNKNKNFRKGKKEPRSWIIHEYRDLDIQSVLDDATTSTENRRIDRYVLCMIYQKGKRSPTTSPPSTPPINIGITGGIKEVGESPNSLYKKYMSSTLPYQHNSTEEWPLTESIDDFSNGFFNPTPSVHNSTEEWPLTESIDDFCNGSLNPTPSVHNSTEEWLSIESIDDFWNGFLNPTPTVHNDLESQECPYYVDPYPLW